MKNKKYICLLSPIYLLLGLAALGLHRWLFSHYVEDPVSGLLPFAAAPEILLWVLTVCAALGAFLLPRRARMGESSPVAGALSSGIFAAGVLMLLLEPVKGPAALVLIYQIFCVATAISLIASAVLRLLGKTPHFLLEVSPCVLCILHLMEFYQSFSEVPQLMNYVLGLGAVLCLTLSAYYRMARAAGLPTKPHQFAIGLLAVYFCAAAVSQGIYVPYFAAAAVWMATEMARLRPAEE
ncbi:MAG: hypothetical protein ACI3XG_09720 [Faecousia sp.]